jgi:hypothetical protein
VNTHINYQYRDASNYKAYPQSDIIIEGELTWSDFKPALHMGEMFIPHDLDLPELQSQLENYPNQDDHIWHQLLDLELTDADPTTNITADEIRQRLETFTETGWNESDAFERHEFMNTDMLG